MSSEVPKLMAFMRFYRFERERERERDRDREERETAIQQLKHNGMVVQVL